MAFKVGQRVGNYEFLRVLGATASTKVFEAKNVVKGRREMIKLLPKEAAGDKEGAGRFEREAEIRGKLSHPNIAEFYGVIDLDGELAMTMEMAPGVSLEERLAEGPISMSAALEIGEQTLNALEYAHESHIVHREITPANLYLGPDGAVKLTGFSLARGYQDPKLTAPGTVIGNVHYLSPEQVKGIQDFDGRSDIYSLGVVLFEALTGQKPFDSKSQFDIIQAHVLESPPVPTDLREDLPDELSRILLKALEKMPEDRFHDARRFRIGLEQAHRAVRLAEGEDKPFQVRDPIDDLEEAPVESGILQLPPELRDAIDRRQRAKEGEAAPGPGSAPSAAEPSPVFRGAAAAFAGAAAAVAEAPERADRPGFRARDLVIGGLTFFVVAALILMVMLKFA